jgi:opacity protein-like surface antigen
MPRTKLLLALTAALFLSSSIGRAQGVRVFVMGSGSFLENERFFSVSRVILPPTLPPAQQFRSNYASGGKVTFGGEISTANVLGVEVSYGYGRNNLRVTDLGGSQTLGYGVRTQRVSGNLMVHSPTAFLGVRPYATAGLEYDHFGPTSQAKTLAFTQGFAGQLVTLGASNQVGFNYGGGAEWSFLPAVALRLDLRDHITGTPTYGLPRAVFPISGTTHDVELSAGLTFHLGH